MLVNLLLTKLGHNKVHLIYETSLQLPTMDFTQMLQGVRLREQDELIQWIDLNLGMSDSQKGPFYLPPYAFLFSNCML